MRKVNLPLITKLKFEMVSSVKAKRTGRRVHDGFLPKTKKGLAFCHGEPSVIGYECKNQSN